MISIDQLGDSLHFIMQDNEVFDQLQQDFPNILADLVTFKNNPSCSCRARVVKFFTEQLIQDPLVLNKYVKDLDALKAHLDKIMSERQTNNYSGKIFTIPSGQESWLSFASLLQGKMFRSFSIVDKGDEIMVYFL
jgi:hypothetical protein